MPQGQTSSRGSCMVDARPYPCIPETATVTRAPVGTISKIYTLIKKPQESILKDLLLLLMLLNGNVSRYHGTSFLELLLELLPRVTVDVSMGLPYYTSYPAIIADRISRSDNLLRRSNKHV